MYKNLFFIIIILFSSKSYAQWDSGDYLEFLGESLKEIRFFDENNGYAYGGATLIHTSDGGSSWGKFTIPDYVEVFSYRPLSGTDLIDVNSAIVVGAKGRILKTSNKGQSWEYKPLLSDEGEDLVSVSFPNETTGYILGKKEDNGSTLYKSTDAGESWVKIQTDGLGILDSFRISKVFFIDEETGFVLSKDKIYRTLNGGIDWQELNNPSTGDKNVLNIKKADGNRVIIGTSLSNLTTAIILYYTTDFGDNWTKIEDLDFVFSSPVFDVVGNKIYGLEADGITDFSFVKYDLDNHILERKELYQDHGRYTNDLFFLNDQVLYLIEVGREMSYYSEFSRRIIKSNDEGNSWQEIDAFSVQNNKDLKLIKIGERFVAAMSKEPVDGSLRNSYILTSTDDGNSWKNRLMMEDTQGRLLFADENKIRAVSKTVGQPDIALNVSNDFGLTWQNHIIPGTQSAVPIFFQMNDGNNLFYYFGDIIRYSTNFGQSWTELPKLQLSNGTYPEFPLKNHYLKNPNEIYAWGKVGPTGNKSFELFKLINQQSWEKVLSIPETQDEFIESTVFFISENKAFLSLSTIADNYYMVDLTNNTYQPHDFVTPFYPYWVDYQNLYILTEDTWMYRGGLAENYLTHDQGLTWNARSCAVCGNNYVYDNQNGELILYNDDQNEIERLKDYSPNFPFIFGNTQTEPNETETYLVPPDEFSTAEWELVSGGTVIEQDEQRIKIKWTQNGLHTLRVKYMILGAPKFTYEIQVAVGQLGTNEQYFENISVWPNPFKSELNIQIPEGYSAGTNTFEFYLYDSVGRLVNRIRKNGDTQIKIDGLDHLENGIYYLALKCNNRFQMFKLIKN